MLTIGYLASHHGRAADTFIRAEVEQIRKLGFAVQTFSIRAPSEHEIVSDAIFRERQTTEDLLGAGVFCLVGSALWRAILHPCRFARALCLAVRIGTPGLRGRLWPMAYLLEACLLARRMQTKCVKHLHNCNGFNSAAVAMLASLLSDIPYSLRIDGPNEFDVPLTLALNEKIKRSKFTATSSNFSRSQLMRWCATEHWHKIYVVRSGLLSEFKLAITTDVPDVQRIVCVARFVEQKGHLLLIEAVAQLVRKAIKVEVDLIGDGPLQSTIQASIARHELQKHVNLLGWKSSSEVRLRIESSRGLMISSFAEGLPVALMEAMALARPVIGTNVGAISELVKHRKHGWLVPAGSIEELAAALREMLDTPVEILTEMGREGRKCVLERHDAGREALKLVSFIKESSTAGIGATTPT